MTRAFTILEVLVYCALYSFIMTGAFASAWFVHTGSRTARSEALLLQEHLYERYTSTATSSVSNYVP